MQDEFNDPLWRQILSGAQMLFVAFGALVLMPLITGLDPNVALFTAGLGTLLFQVVTGRQVPVFLASSFAFITPIILAKQQFGLAATMGGVMAAGFVYTFLGAAVKIKGTEPPPWARCLAGQRGVQHKIDKGARQVAMAAQYVRAVAQVF